MVEHERLLELIEEGVVAHGGDLSGWTARSDDTLKLFDGRVTLRVDFPDANLSGDAKMVHSHIYVTLHDHDDEVLDCCVFGMGNDLDASLREAAFIWLTSVAGPIKSFLDNKPICMTCQAGVADGDVSAGYSRGDYGLPGLRAYVGPVLARGFGQQPVNADDTYPWFRYATEAAAPRRVHLAKATICFHPERGWHRELEIDGHDVSHKDTDWPPSKKCSNFGYMTRFAVFEFPRNSAEIARRTELEKAIRYFAENYSLHESTDQLMKEMVDNGFDPNLVHETESISTIAFGRTFFQNHNIQYSPVIYRARRDGRVEKDVPLMSLPAYTRARALAIKLSETMPENEFQALCLYNAESHVILQALTNDGKKVDLSHVTLYPLVVPDLGVPAATMNAAVEAIKKLIESDRAKEKKPWWKFW